MSREPRPAIVPVEVGKATSKRKKRPPMTQEEIDDLFASLGTGDTSGSALEDLFEGRGRLEPRG